MVKTYFERLLYQNSYLVTRDNSKLQTTIYRKPTHHYRPITRPVFVQPGLSQGYYYPDFDEKSATSLRLTWQPTRQTDYLNNILVRTITTRTLLDGTLTVTMIPTLKPTLTLALLRQRLYRTSEAPLKLLHVYYNLTIYVLHTNR